MAQPSTSHVAGEAAARHVIGTMVPVARSAPAHATDGATTSSAVLLRSLRRFIICDQLTCCAGVAVILVVYVSLLRSGYLLVLAGMVTMAAAVMGLGRRALADSDGPRAVLCVAVANWLVALGATTVATFCVPIMVVAAMLPSILAVPYVGTRLLWRISAASMCVSLLGVALGTLQDFSGLTADLPSWLPPAILLAFVPFITGLVVMVSAHNSGGLSGALTATLYANELLRDSEHELRESRARLVAATDEERRRIARDLHDGAQQRLISLGLDLQRARRLLGSDVAAADQALQRLSRDLQDSIGALRDLTQGVYPPVLTDRGLGEALAEMTSRVPLRVVVDVGGGPIRDETARALPRWPPEVEASVYWCCVEALQNVTKHAGPQAQARIRVAVDDANRLIFSIEDDGIGFDPAGVRRGQGLTNMEDRIRAVGGQLMVWSLPGSGVRVTGAVPLCGHSVTRRHPEAGSR